MTMQSHLPPSNDSLDQDERELLEAVESGAMRSIATPDLLNQLRGSAQVTGQKDQRINIRLSATDLEALRVRALRLGMPYQTLISSVLHRYVSGEFRDEQLV
jgi:predicted DNA binding CopG/RHH family protein